MHALKFSLALLALTLTPGLLFAAPAGDAHNSRARALIARMKANPPKRKLTAATPLLNFHLSPTTPTEGQPLRAYIQSDNTYGNRELSLDLKQDGVANNNVQSPYKGLFIVPLGIQSSRGTHTLATTLYIADPQTNTDVRDAVKALDVDIRRLTNQINAERDNTKRKILESQRQEKLALKDELLTQLKKFRQRVGTQNYSYKVGNETAPTSPTIYSVSPASGPVTGGTEVVVSGVNFSSNVNVRIGGLLCSNVQFLSANMVKAVTPDFNGDVGAKDLELKFNAGQPSEVVATAVSAFFASNSIPTTPQKPIAIAGGSQAMRVGDSLQLDGSQSYSGRDTTFEYRWTIVSANPNSAFTPGQLVGTVVNPTFTPVLLNKTITDFFA